MKKINEKKDLQEIEGKFKNVFQKMEWLNRNKKVKPIPRKLNESERRKLARLNSKQLF